MVGKKKIGLNSLHITPETLGDDSDDSDFEDGPDRSPSKRSRPSRKKPSKSNSQKKKKKRGNSYTSDEDDDLSAESAWTHDEEDQPLEMTSTGRPMRKAVKSRVTYEESDEESSESSAISTESDEDEPVKPKRSSVQKSPSKPKRPLVRKGGRRRAHSEDEEEVDDSNVEDQAPPATTRNKLIVTLKVKAPPAPVTRRATRAHMDETEPLVALTNSGRHIEEVKRETTVSPKERQSRSRSIARTTGNKAPVKAPVYSQPPRRTTRANSSAARSSVAPEDVGVVDPDVSMESVQDPAMSRITEVSSNAQASTAEDTSVKVLTNGSGTGSGQKTDDTFHPLETSTSNAADSLELPMPIRDTQGLLTAADIPEGDSGRRHTRSSIGHHDNDDEEHEQEENAQQQGTDKDEAIAVPDDDDDDDDDEDEPVAAPRRSFRRQESKVSAAASGTQRSTRNKKRSQAPESSDDEYADNGDEEDEEESASESDKESPKKGQNFVVEDSEEESGGARRSTRQTNKRKRASDSDEALDLQEEIAELIPNKRSRRVTTGTAMNTSTAAERALRKRAQPIDYRVWRPDLLKETETSPPPSSLPNRGRKNGGGVPIARQLFKTNGPFGGTGQGTSIFGSARRSGMGGYDSDSSDDGLLPTGGGGGPSVPPGLGKKDSISGRAGGVGVGGTPANLGKMTSKSKQLLADADPLGVDLNVDFSKIGGLQNHINQLKEMVSLPLLYPEIFINLGVTPPRGVLFHGPPGTGKTLLARALAASCSTEGRKISFYMRKGADCLSKWVGEAERQLRLLFEEARNNQPSIIFFDEIDGLAPVRSSKQEQIHASIVSTLLALMDGMDGRGQVIVIGATNRPDSVDPALRRPGRFDREFYFPLPDKEARKSIINIHTSGWVPGLKDDFKGELAALTKGYGGADLRALCTEAALNAVQRKYPQIYKETTKKFLIDPKSIEVTARDFMLSIQKIVPSSERSTTSGAAPLPEHIQPLLESTLDKIKSKLTGILPEKKRLTALEEAEFEDYNDADGGFGRERMLRDFENARVFKPRLLVHGARGMGQGYIGAAVLHHFEGFHVQTVNLPILMGDPSRTAEVALIQIFVELKRHKPSVLYIPDFENWFQAVSEELITTFTHLLNSISPSEPILLFGLTSEEITKIDPAIVRDFFGYTRKCRLAIDKPDEKQRERYFLNAIGHIKKSPNEFPDPATRPKRILQDLPLAPPPPPKLKSPEEIQADKKAEHYLRHLLKIRLMPVIDMMKQKYKRFKKPFVAEERLLAMVPPKPPADDVVASDIPIPIHADVEITADEHGEPMIHDLVKDKKFYNLDLEMIEERIFNGYYWVPQQFLEDIRHLSTDCQVSGDRTNMLQGSELLTNAEIAMVDMENEVPQLCDEWQKALQRSTDRKRQRADAKKRSAQSATDARNGTSEHKVDWQARYLETIPLQRRQQAMMAPQTPLQAQMQRHPMEPLMEEQSSTSNGYIASSERENQISKSNDSDGDLVMSDLPFRNQIGQPISPGSGVSMIVNTTHTSRQYQFSQGNEGQPFSVLQHTESQNVTQRSAGTQNYSSVGVTSTQRQFQEFANDASTTTSGRKTDGYTQSNATNSGSRGANQQEFHQEGHVQQPEFHRESEIQATPDISFGGTYVVGDSQLDDTQALVSSDGSTQPSQKPAPSTVFPRPNNPYSSSQSNSHPSQRSQLSQQQQSPNNAILPQRTQSANPAQQNQQSQQMNTSIVTPLPSNMARAKPDPPLLLEQTELASFLRTLVQRTNDFSIEQLEQVNAAIMDVIWRHRGSWDRNEILVEAEEALLDALEDIAEMEKLVASTSFESKGKERGRVLGEILGRRAEEEGEEDGNRRDPPVYPNILDDSAFSNV